MKKNIVLIISLLILITLGWFTYKVMNASNVSDSELIAFNIEDIETVDKIKIKDIQGFEIELTKKNNQWETTKGDCIQQENVQFILDAIKNIEFKGYLPENSRETQIKLLAVQHTKVDIYQNGEWSKTWYIGSASQATSGFYGCCRAD